MKQIIIFTIILISTSCFAQDQYTQGMEKAFEHWGNNEYDDAVALFERIGQAEETKWQPIYYAANVLITSTFTSKDNTQKFLLLEKAKGHIKTAHKRSPDNSEITTLEGVLYTGYVAADPGTYAMQYSQKIIELHNKAIELNPNNPRAISNKIEYEMNTASFFGQDLAPFCKRLKETLPKYDKQEESQSFNPTYGKERIIKIIENCAN